MKNVNTSGSRQWTGSSDSHTSLTVSLGNTFNSDSSGEINGGGPYNSSPINNNNNTKIDGVNVLEEWNYFSSSF